MPGKVKVRILSGRHLPVMDRSSDTTDAFAEVKLADTTYKTDVYRKSLNPNWNSEWFRFDVADRDLQDEPLQIRIMDYDTYSANDAIGKVYINLNPLLISHRTSHQSSSVVTGGDQEYSGANDINSQSGESGIIMGAPLNPLSSGPGVSVGDDSAIITPTWFKSSSGGGSLMSGWLPIFDTINGVRGEVNVQVKVELFSDHNKFRQSSCGVQFFCTPNVPEGYRSQFINGFVEELVVNDDPEYQWIDKIRTPRASNEARQTLFMKLSGAVQRKIGLKALELGGNAVVGYQQKFDLEGDTGIVVRGIGTAMTLIKISNVPDKSVAATAPMTVGVTNKESEFQQKTSCPTLDREKSSSSSKINEPTACPLSEMKPQKDGNEEASIGQNKGSERVPEDNDKSPDSETGCSPPKGSNSVDGKTFTTPKASSNPNKLPIESSLGLEIIEYPFVTLKKFPRGYIQRFGGLVSCRSVKLLEHGHEEEEDLRDSWWTEIRREIRSHARALCCNLIVGYTEDTVISEDVVVLCASGTAVIVDLSMMLDLESVGTFGPPFIPFNPNTLGTYGIGSQQPPTSAKKGQDPVLFERSVSEGGGNEQVNGNTTPGQSNAVQPQQGKEQSCCLVHLPYNDISLPFTCRVLKCKLCGKGRVPDVLFTTVEPPKHLEINGRGCFLQAKILRLKRDLKGENNAKEISEALPFVEYEIHRQLINKLKMKGMNALFGLKTKLSISDRTIVATATATAAYISALPPPTRPRLVMTTSTNSANHHHDQQYLQRMQQRLEDKVAESAKYYGINVSMNASNDDGETEDSNDADLDGEGLDADLSTGNKDTCVLEIDDLDDANILDSLMDQFPPPNILVYSTEEIIGLSPEHVVRCCQSFTQMWRGKVHPSSRDLSNACQKLLSSIYFKLRRLRPYIICSLDFKADFNEENELQLSVYGTAIALAYNGRTRYQIENSKDKLGSEKSEITSCFASSNYANGPTIGIEQRFIPKCKIKRPNDFYADSIQSHHTINLTPLSYVPGARIEKYLGNLNFFLIRETSSLREVGGISSFVQSFICEIYSIVRSHVNALGGNAVVCYFMSEFVVIHSVHKNQAQCLIHIGGDAVKVAYVPFQMLPIPTPATMLAAKA